MVVKSTKSAHYIAPGFFTRRIMDPAVSWLTARGISIFGAQILAVRGRHSGQWRRTPVNPLEYEGRLFLIAPRGHTAWTHNLRASKGGMLIKGRRHTTFTAREVADSDKSPLLRAYLRRWQWEVGIFFEGVNADSTASELQRIAPRHPVFELLVTAAH